MTTTNELTARLNELFQMEEGLEDNGGRMEECDDCHRETLVVVDPSTVETGEYVYCKGCVWHQVKRIKDKLARLREATKTPSNPA